jgi:DNA-binding NarL/FixJ family response regulator
MTETGLFVILVLMIRVLIVDDQPVFRRQLSELLHAAGWEVVGEANDIHSAESLAQAVQPDLALVDVMLPGINGIEGTPLLKKAATKMHVVLVSAYHDQFKLFQDSARLLGAEAFISKDELDLEMIERLAALLKTR